MMTEYNGQNIAVKAVDERIIMQAVKVFFYITKNPFFTDIGVNYPFFGKLTDVFFVA